MRLSGRRVFRQAASCRGASLLEAAVATPLLLLLTLGIVDLAAVFWVWLALENGASQATRYAVTGNQMGASSREASIRQAMKDATPGLEIDDSAFTFSHLSSGESTWTGGIGGPDDIGKVTVRYTWSLLTPYIRPFFPGGRVTFEVESAMKMEPRFQ